MFTLIKQVFCFHSYELETINAGKSGVFTISTCRKCGKVHGWRRFD